MDVSSLVRLLSVLSMSAMSLAEFIVSTESCSFFATRSSWGSVEGILISLPWLVCQRNGRVQWPGSGGVRGMSIGDGMGFI